MQVVDLSVQSLFFDVEVVVVDLHYPYFIQEMKMTNLISLHSNVPRLQHNFYIPPRVA